MDQQLLITGQQQLEHLCVLRHLVEHEVAVDFLHQAGGVVHGDDPALQQVFHEIVPAAGCYRQAGQSVRAVWSQDGGVELLFHQLAKIAHQGQAQATYIVHVLLGQGGQLAGTEQLAPLQLAAVLGQVAPQVAEVRASLQGQAALGQDSPVAPVCFQVEIVPDPGIRVADTGLAGACAQQWCAGILVAVKAIGVIGHVDRNLPRRVKLTPADAVLAVTEAFDMAGA